MDYNNLAKIIKNHLEFDDCEMSDTGFYFIPFDTFISELCATFKDGDSLFSEQEFLGTIGFQKLTTTKYICTDSEILNK